MGMQYIKTVSEPWVKTGLAVERAEAAAKAVRADAMAAYSLGPAGKAEGDRLMQIVTQQEMLIREAGGSLVPFTATLRNAAGQIDLSDAVQRDNAMRQVAAKARLVDFDGSIEATQTLVGNLADAKTVLTRMHLTPGKKWVYDLPLTSVPGDIRSKLATYLKYTPDAHVSLDELDNRGVWKLVEKYLGKPNAKPGKTVSRLNLTDTQMRAYRNVMPRVNASRGVEDLMPDTYTKGEETFLAELAAQKQINVNALAGGPAESILRTDASRPVPQRYLDAAEAHVTHDYVAEEDLASRVKNIEAALDHPDNPAIFGTLHDLVTGHEYLANLMASVAHAGNQHLDTFLEDVANIPLIRATVRGLGEPAAGILDDPLIAFATTGDRTALDAALGVGGEVDFSTHLADMKPPITDVPEEVGVPMARGRQAPRQPPPDTPAVRAAKARVANLEAVLAETPEAPRPLGPLSPQYVKEYRDAGLSAQEADVARRLDEARASTIGVHPDELHASVRAVQAGEEIPTGALWQSGLKLDDIARATTRARVEPLLSVAPPKALVDAGLGEAKPLQWIKVGEGTPYARDLAIPGGFKGEFSLWDFWRLKAQQFNPSLLSEADSYRFYAKVFRTQKRALTNVPDIFNRVTFGVLSPQLDLLKNEAGAAVMRVSGLLDKDVAPGQLSIESLARMSTEDVMAQMRRAGVGGVTLKAQVTAQLRNARRFLANPEWYKIKPGEDMLEYSERMMSSLDGAGMKVGNFGVMLGDPFTFGRGTIDSHMAEVLHRGKYVTDAEVAPLTELVRGDVSVGEFERLMKTVEGKNLTDPEVARLIADGKLKIKYKNATARNISPRGPDAPAYLRNIPTEVQRNKGDVITFGSNYKTFVDALDTMLKKEHPNLPFEQGGGQWFLWDRERGIFEPHTTVFPGSYKLPRMTPEEIAAAVERAREAGYFKDMPEGTPPEALGARRVPYSPLEGVFWQGPAVAGEAAPRGWTVRNAVDTVMGFTRTHDLSTVIHEWYHGIGEPSLSPEQYAILERHGAVGEPGSRMFERYFATGVAPTAELASVFAQMKEFLLRVYANIKGSPLEAKLHPNVRAVFDEMLGGRPGIDRAAAEAELGKARSELDALTKPSNPARKVPSKPSVAWQRRLDNVEADMSVLPNRDILEAPEHQVGRAVLSLIGRGDPTQIGDLLVILREIENGNAQHAGMGPAVLAKGQRLADALLQNAESAARTGAFEPGVVFMGGTFPNQLTPDFEEMAQRLFSRDAVVMDPANPVGMTYGFKKAGKDAIVTDFEGLRREADASGIPSMAEELFSGYFQPYQQRILTSKTRQAFNYLFGPYSSRDIKAAALGEFTSRAARLNVLPEDARRVWDAWHEYARNTNIPKIATDIEGVRRTVAGHSIMTSPTNIPGGKLLELARKATDHKLEYEKVPWDDLFRTAYSGPMQFLADSHIPFGQKMKSVYSLVTNNDIVRFHYYQFRFNLDARFHAMNAAEALLLYLGRYVFKRGMPTGLRQALLSGIDTSGMSARDVEHIVNRGILGMAGQRLLDMSEDAIGTTGYAWTRSKFLTAQKAFLKVQPRGLLDAMGRLEKENPELIADFTDTVRHDPILGKLVTQMGDTPEAYVAVMDRWYNRIFAAIDPSTPFSEEIALAIEREPAMVQVYQALDRVNRQMWDDVQATFLGNPARSRAERALNHYLLYWPFSYTVRTSKWLLRVLYGGVGGAPVNSLGAYELNKMIADHNKRLAEDPGYGKFLKDNPSLMFAAQMFLPIGTQFGVGLNPLVRDFLFNRTKNFLEIGPVYSYEKLLPNVMGDLYTTLADVPYIGNLMRASGTAGDITRGIVGFPVQAFGRTPPKLAGPGPDVPDLTPDLGGLVGQ
jgi:hypothetical protein